MSNSLYPDQAQHFVESPLGLNCVFAKVIRLWSLVVGKELIHENISFYIIKVFKNYLKDTIRVSNTCSLNPGLEVIKLFSWQCSTQLSTKFILLINVKMPTIVGILTFISMINTTSERLKARKFSICWYFNFYEQLKFRVLS